MPLIPASWDNLVYEQKNDPSSWDTPMVELLSVGLGLLDWDLIMVPSKNSPFHKGILGLQTNNPNQQVTIRCRWLKSYGF